MEQEKTTRDYLFSILTQIKLDEKDIQKLQEERIKWEELYKTASAEGDISSDDSVQARLNKIDETILLRQSEIEELKKEAEDLKKSLRLGGNFQQSIDTDLLEQELLILRGEDLDREEERKMAERLEALKKEEDLEKNLVALKASMGNASKEESPKGEGEK